MNFENINHPGVQNVCTSWKSGLREIWGLPYDSHSNLLQILSHSLPLFDLICRSSFNILQNVQSESLVVNFISYHGIFLGVLSHRSDETPYLYNVSLFDLINNNNNYIIRWYNNTLNDELISRVSMLAEVLFNRDESYVLPGFDLQYNELRTYINYLSRCD